jgi:hypothetical protein
MKRADAQKALVEIFCDVLQSEYRGPLITSLAKIPPDTEAARKQFRVALDINLAAYTLASEEVASRPDLED